MKKILTLTLALMMALSLAACGGKDDLKPSGGDKPATSQQAEQPSNTPDDSKPSGDEKAPADNDGEWSKAEYADYTNGVPEPEFTYSIEGASKVLGLSITYSIDDAQLDTWTQALLDSGFTLTEEDNYGVDTYESDTHTVEVSGTSGAYILIK